MTEQELAMPLPKRPGTLWKMRAAYPHICEHCGKGYNSHGAPRANRRSTGCLRTRRVT